VNSPLTDVNFQRALLLFHQSRHALAEEQLRQGLALEPRNASAHALLALCLAHREQFKEATAEAQQAIHLEPDLGFAHYALARVLLERERLAEALNAIGEAIRLEPAEADYFALLAALHAQQLHWQAAAEAAERGLQTDPEHIGCTNLRAMALVKLGRRAEAGATIAAALAKNPESALTHANQGWTLLEKGEPKKALEHFREALRLDPGNEWAQRGIVEALKARNIIYAVMLKYFLWMSRFSSRTQWAIILGGVVGSRLLASLSNSIPAVAPWILPLRILYVSFALMTWMAYPFFNLLLRLNRFGRLVLSREQTLASTWFGLCLLCALVGLAGCFIYGFGSSWLVAAVVFGFLLLPVSAVYKCASGWPRNTMTGLTVVVALLGLATLTVLGVAAVQPEQLARATANTGEGLFSLFLVGAIGSTWAANLLGSTRPRR
jgi:tetratricopeptide (TPR) repeat protein